jgi:hypothetical protein
MTNSLRTAAQIAKLDQSPVSVRDLAGKFDLLAKPPPVSLRELLDEIVPEQVTWSFDNMEAGDVSGSASFTVLKNGYWILNGQLWDSGDYYGDDFVLIIGFKHHANIVHGTTVSGHVGHQSWNYIKEHGRDPWIKENWEDIKAKGALWDLEVNPSPTFLTDAGFLTALGIFGGFLWMALGGSGDTQCTPTEDGYVCHKEW